ncbi:TPA: HDOD domain-containing protein [Vibrio cholerae]|nr:EAL and HDOD domain-containing protein [Vibrio cholerae]HDZ9635372.1 HDOD domain-containing protein [Vibrio cholerae]
MDRKKSTIGYELLFRDGPKNTFPDIDPEEATSRLLSDHFLTAHYSTLGDLLGFVNFPYQSLLNMVPTLFPIKSMVVEILEDCPPTPELLSAIKKMAQLGYKIALDDFIPSNDWKAFLPYISIIKFDIRLVPIPKAKLFINKLRSMKIEFLAEKVETYEEFEQAKQAGFHYFQGYFFSKPEIIQRKALQPSFLTIVQLLKEVAKPEVNFREIETIVAKDISLSYKLLTFVNSSATVSSKIQSFRQALVYLGQQKLRKFVSLVAIASTQDSKPDYLYNLAILRARFCEMLSQRVPTNIAPGTGFLTGMFSVLDSLLDQSLDSIVKEMPIEEEVKQALTQGSGTLGQILALNKAYEMADWGQVVALGQALNLTNEAPTECYIEAVKWTADLLGVQT